MRRVLFPLLIVAMLLVACGGTADLTVVTPPNATKVDQTANAKIDAILKSWQASVPTAMTDHQIKADSIQQAVYTSKDTLANVQQYYVATFADKNGWRASTRTPGLDATQGVLIDAYEHGTTSLTVAALDATKYGGTGIVIYTVTGHK